MGFSTVLRILPGRLLKTIILRPRNTASSMEWVTSTVVIFQISENG
jgi:hypothetical protein